MARTARQTSKTAFGQKLLAARNKTKTPRGYYSGSWPLGQHAFCDALNRHIEGEPISPFTYLRWENGDNLPSPETQARVLAALKKHKAVDKSVYKRT